MPNYPGRFTQSMFTKNFGGIDSRATVLNISDNEAANITNFNVGLDGAITRRTGTALSCGIGEASVQELVYWTPFYDSDGIERFGAIAKTKTNICSESNAFTTSPWSGFGPAQSIQNQTDPFGIQNSAWTVTDSSVTDTQSIWQPRLLSLQPYIYSFYVKKTTGTQATYPLMYVYLAPYVAAVTIDTTNGVVTPWVDFTGLTIIGSTANCYSIGDFWEVVMEVPLPSAGVWEFGFEPAAVSDPTQSTGIPDGTLRGSAVIYECRIEVSDTTGQYHWFDCDTVDGTYVDRGDTGMTLGSSDAHKYVGANWKGAVLVANGTDIPIYAKYGENVKDLKTASQIDDPTTIITTLVPATGYGITVKTLYGVTAVTPRGETIMADCGTYGIDYANFTPSIYNLLSWDPVAGASAYRIYMMFNGSFTPLARGFPSTYGSYTWARIADVPGSQTTWSDSTSVLPTAYTEKILYPPSVNTAFRTWEDWEKNGWPAGFTVVARGRDERLFAWRESYIWASAINNPLDWLAESDSFVFSVDAGMDKNIVAITSLYEYILIFTRTMCFIYTGASAETITLQKVVPRGCVSPASIVNFDGDVYFWSDYGPTSFKRIQAGADVSSASAFNRVIQNILFEQTNTAQWGKIAAYRYIPESRLVWAVPSTESEENDIAIVYQADVKAWSKYDNWSFSRFAVTSAYGVYGIRVPVAGESKLWDCSTGNTDNGSTITATYKTAWYDMRAWDNRKRLVWTDVIVDRSVGNYTFSINWSWDYGVQTSSPITCTETTTDGCTIETTSSTTSDHRIYADGIGNAFQLTFETSASTPLKVIGWRPEIRSKGIRQ